MTALIVLAVCHTVVVNKTPIWTTDDEQTLSRAKVRCQELYPDAPCTKMFIKKDIDVYNVVCGASK